MYEVCRVFLFTALALTHILLLTGFVHRLPSVYLSQRLRGAVGDEIGLGCHLFVEFGLSKHGNIGTRAGGRQRFWTARGNRAAVAGLV